MEVLFFLPAQLALYDTKVTPHLLANPQPAKYLTTLIGRGEKGSPSALLSLLGYSNGLKCSIAQDSVSFSLLLIKVAVTPKGLENYQEILQILFQDLRMLKKNATWQWHYPQKIMQGEVEFRFTQPHFTLQRVQDLTYQMQAPIPVHHIFLPQDRLLRYDEQQIKSTLRLISPDSMT
ncbi:metalloprotease [Entomophthora muscae]|uniref:Metalloprotease n=1 Tax=Entomophthora muscae TaxID=34485 RepID=A0ACC2RNF6_9FUNG|nr:metalloprotease [Entomophthora muscae]